VSVVCCQVEVSATGRSLVRRINTECSVSECDRESLIMMRPWLTGGCWATIKKGSKHCPKMTKTGYKIGYKTGYKSSLNVPVVY